MSPIVVERVVAAGDEVMEAVQRLLPQLSRSAVATHIAQLTREQRILGRAYLLPDSEPILVIGGANVDRKAKSIAPVVMGTSNPMTVNESYGGVGRNVAENLSRLGLPVRLMTAVGDDAQGSALLKHARDLGIDTGASLTIPGIATALNLSRADVHGVVTFYHDFRRTPTGRHVVKLCRAESCQARGAAAIEKAATDRLGVPMGETRPDGQVTLEPVYCLGLCAVGPNALVDGRPVARIDAATLDRIAQEIAA